MDAAKHNILSEIEEIMIAAERGDPDAQFHLGWNYYIGNGVACDKTKAIKWYAAAAIQGLHEAQEILEVIEANKIRQPKESFEDVEENELQTSASRIKKWKILTALASLCAFFGLLMYCIGKNAHWFHKVAKVEKNVIQSDLVVVDLEKTIGNKTDSTEALQTETLLDEEEILIEPNSISNKMSKNEHETKIADKKSLITPTKSQENTGTRLMEQLAIFADEWLDSVSEPNEVLEKAEQAKKQD